MYCKVSNCRFPYSHTTRGHKCGKCNIFGHGQVECNNIQLRNKLQNYYNDELPLEEQCNVLNCENNKYHTTSAHICKFCKVIGHAEYECPDNEFDTIECPLCRKTNVLDKNQLKMFGIEDLCKVCKENKINIYLPDCGHACLCNECFDEIKRKDED